MPFASQINSATARMKDHDPNGALADLREGVRLLDESPRLSQDFKFNQKADADAYFGKQKPELSAIYRDAWRAPVVTGDARLDDDWVVLLPLPEAIPELSAHLEDEVRALADMRAAGVELRVPEVLAAWHTETGEPILVERFVAGFPADLRAGRSGPGEKFTSRNLTHGSDQYRTRRKTKSNRLG